MDPEYGNESSSDWSVLWDIFSFWDREILKSIVLNFLLWWTGRESLTKTSLPIVSSASLPKSVESVTSIFNSISPFPIDSGEIWIFLLIKS